jgi:hypothetical protein
VLWQNALALDGQIELVVVQPGQMLRNSGQPFSPIYRLKEGSCWAVMGYTSSPQNALERWMQGNSVSNTLHIVEVKEKQTSHDDRPLRYWLSAGEQLRFEPPIAGYKLFAMQPLAVGSAVDGYVIGQPILLSHNGLCVKKLFAYHATSLGIAA